ncbi:MAG: hypothetical protein IKS19_03260 [Clostridia bacterium]|nr:hypothetical protein [Clostridia bacterium]
MPKIRERREVANYLNVGTNGAEDYVLLGAGARVLDEKPSAQTVSRRYVNDRSASSSVSGYEWSAPFELDQIRSERAVDYICSIGEKQKTGGDCETDYVMVSLDRPVMQGSTPVPNTYYARKIRVCVEVAEFSAKDGELGCNGNLLGIGDMIEGRAVLSAGTVSFSEDSYGA